MTSIVLPSRLRRGVVTDFPPTCLEDDDNRLPFWQSLDNHGSVKICDFTYKTNQLRFNRRSSRTGEDLRPDFVVVENPRASRTISKRVGATENRLRPLPRTFQVGGRKDKLSAAYQRPKSVTRQDWVRARTAISGYAVNTHADWELIADPSLQSLTNTTLNAKDVLFQDIKFIGMVQKYDESLDLVNSRNHLPVLRSSQPNSFIIPNTQSDEILAELIAKEELGIHVIATDQVVATLMSAPLSRFGWQVMAYRFGNQVVLDKAEGFDNLDVLTQYENIPMEQMLDGRQKEAAEMAASLQVDFQQLAVRNQPVAVCGEELKEPLDPDVPQNRLYRYRTFTLPPSTRRGPTKILIRSEIHAAALTPGGQVAEYFKIHSLNEGLVKVVGPPWSSALERQKGALLLSELSRNSCKIARWMYSSIIAGATSIKLGFLSTKNDETRLLAIQSSATNNLAAQMGLKLGNGWAVLREILDIILSDSRTEGCFVITRDGLSRSLKIHYTALNSNKED